MANLRILASRRLGEKLKKEKKLCVLSVFAVKNKIEIKSSAYAKKLAR